MALWAESIQLRPLNLKQSEHMTLHVAKYVNSFGGHFVICYLFIDQFIQSFNASDFNHFQKCQVLIVYQNNIPVCHLRR